MATMKKQTKTVEYGKEANNGGIQVVARTTRIMRTLSAHPQGLSLAGIAIEVGLPRSTVQRIINALVADNIVEPVGPSGGFRLGPALGQMLYQTQADIVSVLRPHLERLSLQLRETVCLSRTNGTQHDILDQFIGEQTLRVVLPIGACTPLQITAGGKALLARMGEEQLLASLNQLADDDNRLLLADLEKIRESDFAFDYEEFAEGISSIAVAIATYRGYYALTILAPTARMTKQITNFQTALLETKGIVERLVGVSA
jgi:IclR family transcriptional regulator, acetate operon repressor